MKLRGNPDKIRQFQFKPGVSGNPKGRPPDVLKMARKERLSIDELRQVCDGSPALRKAIAKALVDKACCGHWPSLWYLIRNID